MKVCTLLGPLALLLAPALAQDRDPAVLEVQMNGQEAAEAPLGAVLVLEGENLHLCPGRRPRPGRPGNEDPQVEPCRHEDVRVTIRDAEALLLSASPEAVVFIVPQFGLDPGPVQLRLDIAGRRAAEVPFGLLTPEEWERRDRGRDVCVIVEQGPPIPPPAKPPGDEFGHARFGFVLTRFEAVRGADGTRFTVEGRASALPDGFVLALELSHAGPGRARLMDVGQASVVRGQFALTFGPYSSELSRGQWVASATFELAQQGPLRAGIFASQLTPQQREAWRRVVRRTYLQHGTPDDVQGQRARLGEGLRAAGRAIWEAWQRARVWGQSR